MTLASAAARPHPARLLPTTYPVRGTVDARYGDMDANGHLNNLALEAMHENTRATLNAQVSAMPFYARAGFRPTGEQFDEAGIDHRVMTLDLAPR